MRRLKTILVPTDFSRCADQALSWAIEVARVYESRVLLLHVAVLPELDPLSTAYRFDGSKEIMARIEEVGREEMERAVDGHRGRGVEIEPVQLRSPSAAPAILKYAQERRPGLIVMGTHGWGGIGRLLLGSVAEQVVHTAPCSVVTVRERLALGAAGRVPKRLLVPVDFSGQARQALREARELAASFGAQLQLLHVVDDTLVNPAYYGVLSVNDLVPGIEEHTRKELADYFASTPGPEVGFEAHVVHGRPHREIARFAREHGSELIVLASEGLTGIKRLLLGSVTEKAVRHAPCPVLVVRTREARQRSRRALKATSTPEPAEG